MPALYSVIWPALRFTEPQTILQGYIEAGPLARTTYKSISAVNAAREFLLIDSRGEQYQVRNMRTRKAPGPFKRAILSATNAFVDVEIDLVHVSSIALEELKDKIKLNLDAFPEFWEESDDVAELKAKLDKCTSIDSIFALRFLGIK
ncbi:MAG: hypothetical protein LLG01_16960 [Planctomycetaceae bacterium]|nr:hypothetical protein [Planctomycetaceae bacterium]